MQRGRFAHRLSPILRKTSDFDLSSATLEAPSGTSELGPRDDDVRDLPLLLYLDE